MKLMKRVISTIICIIFISILIAITLVCINKIFGTYNESQQIISMQKELRQYKPVTYEKSYNIENNLETKIEVVENTGNVNNTENINNIENVNNIENIDNTENNTVYDEEEIMPESSTQESKLGLKDLQLINSEVFAWIEIYDTDIDYPVTQHDENRYYLKVNAKNEPAYYGSIFMDYRCNKDMSLFNSILYGHKLDEGGMFSSLLKYEDEEFFKSHTDGILYLIDKTYKIDIFAYLTTTYDDEIIYNTLHFTNKDKEEHLQYIHDKSIHYIEIDNIENIVTLSTCNNGIDKGRSVVVGKISVIE